MISENMSAPGTNLLSALVTPLGFAKVEEGVYRSSYPTEACIRFIETLGLKTLIALQPEDIRSDLREYCGKSGINIVEADIGLNQEPFLVMSEEVVNTLLDVLMDTRNHPTMILCNNGRLRTSCLVGCLRRAKNWYISYFITLLLKFAHLIFLKEYVISHR